MLFMTSCVCFRVISNSHLVKIVLLAWLAVDMIFQVLLSIVWNIFCSLLRCTTIHKKRNTQPMQCPWILSVSVTSSLEWNEKLNSPKDKLNQMISLFESIFRHTVTKRETRKAWKKKSRNNTFRPVSIANCNVFDNCFCVVSHWTRFVLCICFCAFRANDHRHINQLFYTHILNEEKSNVKQHQIVVFVATLAKWICKQDRIPLSFSIFTGTQRRRKSGVYFIH